MEGIDAGLFHPFSSRLRVHPGPPETFKSLPSYGSWFEAANEADQ